MPLVVCNNGNIADLNLMTAAYAAGYQIGLYQNNWTPVQTSVIGDVTPCNFSGYVGLLSLPGWTVPVIVGARASVGATVRTWGHDGGGVSNLVYGIYVVNGSGVLVWGERDPFAPRAMATLGDFYAYIPVKTQRSEF